jgi:hypothetical protein
MEDPVIQPLQRLPFRNNFRQVRIYFNLTLPIKIAVKQTFLHFLRESLRTLILCRFFILLHIHILHA